jgi:hypothetical protein
LELGVANVLNAELHMAALDGDSDIGENSSTEAAGEDRPYFN